MKTQNINYCRVCLDRNLVKVLDLGAHPLANRFLKTPDEPEDAYPLDVYLCEKCSHLQLGTVVDRREIFSDYIYSSAPNPMLSEHFKKYADDVKERVPSWREDLIVEIGSNDGLLLKEFQADGDNVLGIDPARNIEAAVPTLREFFNSNIASRIVAEKGRKARVIMANNVVAHTFDLRDMIAGMANLLDDRGLIVIEAPWLGDMFENNAYDTIYHEHLSYFSISALLHLFSLFGLAMVDLQFHPVQGNSFRAFFGKGDSGRVSRFALEIAEKERKAGWTGIGVREKLADQVGRSKDVLLAKLKKLKSENKSIVGYGAPAKGNTIINYTGCAPYLDCLVDDMPSKIGMYAPGLRLRVVPSKEARPDAFVMFAWSYKKHILEKEKDFKGEWIIPNEA
jgi:hypothetical protein